VRDAALGQLDLEAVVGLRARVAERGLGGAAEGRLRRRLIEQRLLGLEGAPGLGADAAERDADVGELAAADLGDDGRRGQGELVRGAIAQLEVMLPAGGAGRGQGDVRDQVARLEDGLTLRRVAGHEKEVADRDGPLALGALHVNDRLQRGERHVHVGRVGGDARLAGAEDGQRAVVAFDGRATRARLALVAGHGVVAEVHAAGALQEVAAGGGHVAQLRRGAGEQRLRQHPVAARDGRMVGEVGVANQRADLQAAVGELLHLVERKPVDVDDQLGALDVELHEVEQGGAAGDEANRRALLRRG